MTSTPAASDAADIASQRLAEWLTASAQGDRVAFRRLYDATSARLLGIAYEVLGDRERAEEVLQDAYIKIWHHAGRYDAAVARPMTWLMRVVRNRAIDVWRSRQHGADSALPLDETLAASLEDPAPRPDQLLAERHGLRALANALPGLPPALRHAIALTLHGGLTPQEVAERCGVTPERARARLREAARTLRRQLNATACG